MIISPLGHPIKARKAYRRFGEHGSPQSISFGQRLRDIYGSSLIGYWKLNELSGSVAADSSGNNRHGSFSNCTLGQPTIGGGTPSTSFVPASLSFANIYTASLAGVFSGTLGTIGYLWMPRNAAYWNAAATGRHFTIGVNGNNRIIGNILAGTPNQITYSLVSGGVTASVRLDSTQTLPMMIFITWNKALNRLRLYKDNVKQGLDVAITGVWAGTIASNTTVIGAASTAGTVGFDGWMSHFFILNTEATQEQINSSMPPFSGSLLKKVEIT